ANGIDLPGGADAVEQVAKHRVEGGALDRPGGVRLGREGGDDLDAVIGPGGDHPAEVAAHSGVALQDLLPGRPALALELLDWRRGAKHRIRLMADLPDRDTHRASLAFPIQSISQPYRRPDRPDLAHPASLRLPVPCYVFPISWHRAYVRDHKG